MDTFFITLAVIFAVITIAILMGAAIAVLTSAADPYNAFIATGLNAIIWTAIVLGSVALVAFIVQTIIT